MEHRVPKLEEFAQDTRDRLTRIETRLEGMATKSDLQLLRVEMNSMNHDLKVEMHSMNHDLKAEMQSMEGKLIKWLVGTALAVSASSLSVVSLVLQRANPGHSAAAPVVIQPSPGSKSAAE